VSVRLAWLGVMAALVLGGNAGAAPTDPELRSRVEGLLGSYRTVTVAEWRAVGPEAAPVLEAVARDPRALPTRRARALAALGVVRSDAAAPLIRELVLDAVVAPVVRSAAIDAAPGVLGADAPHLLIPLLRDPAPRVRLHSAQALASTGLAGCRAVLAEARTRPASDPVARTASHCEAQLRGGSSSER
jgi:HEAT repeat protein